MMNRWILFGAISAFISVGMGAFGAHALATKLSAHALSIYQTAAQYQMYHALALIFVGLWSIHRQDPTLPIAGWAFTVGSFLFSGSLYALALSDVRILGAITPFGGICFLIGWASVAISALPKNL